MERSREQLGFVAILYRILGVLTAVFVIPFVLPMLHAMYSGAGPGLARVCDPVNGPIRILVFGAWNGVIVLAGLAFAAAMFFGARLFEEHRSYPACKVIGVVSCAALPVGTILGAYTLWLLDSPEVRKVYGAASMRPRDPAHARPPVR